jgi:hypothetical protein
MKDDFEEGTKLIWVYDLSGTLVNNGPFFGEKEVSKYIGGMYGFSAKPEWILESCGKNKPPYFYHYLRTGPTKVFVSKQSKTKFRYV